MNQPIPDFDPALVLAARSGDVAACGRLVESTESLVRAAVRGLVRDTALADDVVQETYLRAFGRLGTIRDAAAFPAWLRRVAVSTARNELRRRRGLPVDPVHLDALPSRRAAPDESEDADLLAALRRALVSLPPEQRRTCDRYYRGGWTTARLARDAGIGEAAVRKRLERLRARLGKEMKMTLGTTAGDDGRLSDRIVALLSRPLLLDLPENPVGAVWDRLVELREGDEVVPLPDEEVRDADLTELLGEDVSPKLPGGIHRIDEERFLRFDLTLPMLLAARGRPRGAHLLAAGKVFRDDAEDRSHLQVFHQAELLWTDERLSPWSAMDVLTALLDDLLPGARLRVEEVDYPLYTDRGGYEVFVKDGDAWVSVAGWARFADRVTTALGLDPTTDVALGAGLGLERIACLRYGIDDLRRIESIRVDSAADSLGRTDRTKE